MSDVAVEVLGYAGSILILIAIKYVRHPKHNVTVDLLMLAGQALIAANSFYHGAFPPAILNVISFGLNILNLKKDVTTQREQESLKWENVF